jgi:hypothetical protein
MARIQIDTNPAISLRLPLSDDSRIRFLQIAKGQGIDTVAPPQLDSR